MRRRPFLFSAERKVKRVRPFAVFRLANANVRRHKMRGIRSGMGKRNNGRLSEPVGKNEAGATRTGR